MTSRLITLMILMILLTLKKLASTISMIVWESTLLSELSHTKVVSQNQIFWLWVWVSNHPLPLLLIMTIMTRRPDTTHVLDLASYWRETGGNFTTIPQVLILRHITVITIILWSPSLWSPSLSSLFWHLLVLCRAWVRNSGVREGFPVWLSREEALLSTGVLNLLSLDFSHSLSNLIYQTDILDTTWSSQICSESKISSLALTWQGYHSADSKWNHYEDSSWLALTEQAGRPGDIVLVMLLGGMCAWELYGACIVDWTDGSFP